MSEPRASETAEPAKPASVLNLANAVTLSRVPLALGFVVLYPIAARTPPAIETYRTLMMLCLGLVVTIELTDLFDGQIARRLGCITDFGKLVDPFCDSFARLCIFFAFAAVPIASAVSPDPALRQRVFGMLVPMRSIAIESTPLLPLWIPVLMLLRDLSVAFMRTVAAGRGRVVAARPSGKLKAVVQGPAAIAILCLLAFGVNRPHRIAWLIAIPVVLITIGSMIDYLIANRTVFAEGASGEEQSGSAGASERSP